MGGLFVQMGREVFEDGRAGATELSRKTRHIEQGH